MISVSQLNVDFLNYLQDYNKENIKIQKFI